MTEMVSVNKASGLPDQKRKSGSTNRIGCSRHVGADVIRNDVGDSEGKQHEKKTYGESFHACGAMMTNVQRPPPETPSQFSRTFSLLSGAVGESALVRPVRLAFI